MSDLQINRNVGEFNFSMYEDDAEIYVSDKRTPHQDCVAIPTNELVAFRNALSQIIKELDSE